MPPHDPAPARGEAREDAILTAALELLAETGYADMSMDAIAARARSSKATIYRRWPGKARSSSPPSSGTPATTRLPA